MRLTITKGVSIDDWWLIERAEHDGRVWVERTGPNSSALRCSARLSDADVEGTTYEMLAIADAIERCDEVRFKRCAVDARGDLVLFWSPRNSQERGMVSVHEASELAKLIRETCHA